jgi:hypothetical protein
MTLKLVGHPAQAKIVVRAHAPGFASLCSCNFGQGKSFDRAQPHRSGDRRVELLELPEHCSDGEQRFDVRFTLVRCQQKFRHALRRDCLRGSPGSCIVDQNLPHRPRGKPEEMIFIHHARLQTMELEEQLAYECGRLQRVAAALALQQRRCDRSQAQECELVDRFTRAPIALLRAFEQQAETRCRHRRCRV